MARGRKPKPKHLPKLPPDENAAAFRVTVYHLCGLEILSQSIPDRASAFYHMAFFETRESKDPLLVCPRCRARVSRASIRLPGEQFSYEMAQESLALQLARQIEEQEEEEESDAETKPPS